MEQPQESRLVRKHSYLISRLRELKMDFNDLFILECFYRKEEKKFFDMYKIPSMEDFNMSSRFQFLLKNEYLVENPNDSDKIIISVKGQDLYDDLMLPEAVHDARAKTTVSMHIIDLGKTDEEKFEEWWKKYPTSPAWKTDDGTRVFEGSRTLKNLRKPEAKKRYLKLLNQGLDHEELLGSLLYEIKLKKLDSIKKGQNQMEYFKGMESYFNQERYLLFIDNYRENPDYVKDDKKIKGRKTNVTDI